MAGVVGLREVRYGLAGANHFEAAQASPRTNPTPTSATTQASASCAPAACAPARKSRAPLRSPSPGAASSPRVTRGPGRAVSWVANASPAAPACEACPTATLTEKSRRSSIGQPERSVATTCAYCGVGCGFKAEMKGDTGGAHGALERRRGQRGPRLRQGPLRLGLRHPPGPHHQPR